MLGKYFPIIVGINADAALTAKQLYTEVKKQRINLNIKDWTNSYLKEKYKFINYNGIRNSHLNNLIREASGRDIPDEELEDEDTDITNYKNPFDDKILIIDEAHNFVSRIVNKLKTKKKSLSIKLYELILRASNCRVIFLTGTPVINYPNEIAVLFNMLRGYIKTFQIV